MTTDGRDPVLLSDEQILDGIIKAEGGGKFTNNPADPGGPTKFGITAETLGAWRNLGRDATAEEVAALEEPEAREIYRRRYIPAGITSAALRAVLADCAVLHGTRNATRMLQRAMGVEDDGVLGPITRGSANAWPSISLARRVEYERCRFIARHVTKDLTDADKDGIPDATEFNFGWVNRVMDQLDQLEVA
jgi:lysozyme family protein